MRVRARRRLIGMVVLVGAGVLGFPWLFETQPRPMSGDIRIVQAPQAGGSAASHAVGPNVSPVVLPAVLPAVVAAGTTSATVTAPANVAEHALRTEPAGEREEFLSDVPSRPAAVRPALPASAPSVRPLVRPPLVPAVKPAAPPSAAAPAKPTAPQPSPKSSPKSSDKPAVVVVDKAVAKPVAKPADKDKPLVRYVVQFGAFADAASAQEARMKAEKQGLKTYAQQVDTPQGKRIRVRLGPFTDKAEADKAAAALRKADLPGAVLTL
jgi:DedD protein